MSVAKKWKRRVKLLEIKYKQTENKDYETGTKSGKANLTIFLQ